VIGTRVAFVEVYAAVLRAGAAFVPLLPGLAPDELRHALADAGATVAFVGSERAQDIAALRDELPELEHLVAVETQVAGALDYETLLADAGEPELVTRDAEDLAALVYTSGTTGRPRGAVLTRGNLAANQDQSLAGRFEVGADDVVLLVLPLAHIYALNVGLGTSVTVGATMVLVERFDPVETLETIARHGVTVVLGAPPMYVAWLESGALEGADLSSVRLAVSGAAPARRPDPRAVRRRDRDHHRGGLRADGGVPVGVLDLDGRRADARQRGVAAARVELRLVDGEGEDVETGDPGEVWVRGPNVFQGYWNDPEGTAAALTEDGWLRTGDVGIRDEHGMLRLVDRLRDLIIVSGFNVYPREVERVLLEDDVARRRGRRRGPAPVDRRDRRGVRRRPGGRVGRPRRPEGPLSRASGPLQVPVEHRGGAGPAAHRDRQAAPARAARPLHGLTGLRVGFRRRRARPEVVVYTRQGCGLCRRAEELVRREARGADVRTVDIDTDPAAGPVHRPRPGRHGGRRGGRRARGGPRRGAAAVVGARRRSR
jgi:long-chain acyl-CoA synthetase